MTLPCFPGPATGNKFFPRLLIFLSFASLADDINLGFIRVFFVKAFVGFPTYPGFKNPRANMKSNLNGNMKSRGLKAVIFDMDGVLVDSEPLHLLAFQEFFQRFGISYTAEDNREFLGRRDLVIAEILIERFKLTMTPPAIVEAKEAILSRMLYDSAKPRPGVHELLKELSSRLVPMAVASSATMPTIELVTHTLDIRKHFSNLTSGDEVAYGKPAPDVFLLAAKRLNVEPAKCLVIEDTLNGIKAAKAAGMYCVAIPCEATAHQDHSLADERMESLQDLPIGEIFQVSSKI